jgi:hypothetical protein
MLNELLDALGVAGNVIDTPGAVARGLLAGNTDAAFGGIMDPSKRISGRGLLENYGLVNAKPEGSSGFDFGDALGMGADLLTNPLTYIPGAGLAARAFGGAAKAAPAVADVANAATAASRLGKFANAAKGVQAVAPVAEAAAAPLATAGADAAQSALTPLMNARRSFTMAKNVTPSNIGSLVGGDTANKMKAVQVANDLADEVVGQMRSGGAMRTAGYFQPSENAGAIMKGAAPEIGRHEVIHGLVNAATTGDMSGMPLPVKAAASLYRLGGGAEAQNFTSGMGNVMNELAAHSMQNRGLLNQLQGGASFLFKPGQAHNFYASQFAQTSPLAAALYSTLPVTPYAAGAAGLAGAGYGAYAYGSNPNEER